MTTDGRSGLRIVFTGPMLGRHPGRIVNPAELLSVDLAALGHVCRLTSSVESPMARAADIATTLARWTAWADVVVVATYGTGGAFAQADLASLIAHRAGRPVVLNLRGGALPDLCRRYPRWTSRVLSRAAAVIAPSAFLVSVAPEGCRAEVVPNGLDPLDDGPPWVERPPSLLWMRSFQPHYRPDIAVEVIRRVRRRHPEATLTMAGNDLGELDATRRAARDLGDAVTIVGWLAGSEKVAALHGHRVSLHTNDVDNAPRTLVEGLAAGQAVVARATGGVPDLLTHDVDALLIDGADDVAADRLAAAVCELFDDPARASALVAGGRALVARHDRPTTAARFAEVLQQVVDRSGDARVVR